MKLLEIAKDAASTIEQEAGRMGLPVTICVIDEHGHVTFLERMAGAIQVSIQMAQAKAYTSAMFGMATADLMPLVQPGQPLYGLTAAMGGEFIAIGGGVPIRVDGKLVGGLGVSGGTVGQDIALAQAGISSLCRVTKGINHAQ